MKFLINTLIDNDFSINWNKYEIVVNNKFIIYENNDDNIYFITHKTNKYNDIWCALINKKQYKNLCDFCDMLTKNNIKYIIDYDLIIQ